MKIKSLGSVLLISVIAAARLLAQEAFPSVRGEGRAASHGKEKAEPSLEEIEKQEWAERPRRREEGEEATTTRLNEEKEVTGRASYNVAIKRMRWERHDPVWWSEQYAKIVLAGGGYYYLDGSYWYPARGFDQTRETYPYDGPIYSYNNLPPDQVVDNVQRRLQQYGYYTGAVSGALGPQTRTAIANFQRDYELPLTSAVDELTVKALGLFSTK